MHNPYGKTKAAMVRIKPGAFSWYLHKINESLRKTSICALTTVQHSC